MTRLLTTLRLRWGFALLFITHDLSVAEQVSDEIAVLDEGRIVEQGPAECIMSAPATEPARRLVAAIPRFAF